MILKFSKTVGAVGHKGLFFCKFKSIRLSTFGTVIRNIHKLVSFMFRIAFGAISHEGRLIAVPNTIGFSTIVTFTKGRVVIAIEDMLHKAIIAISDYHLSNYNKVVSPHRINF